MPATRLTPCSFVAHIVEFAPHFVPQAYALSSPSVILDVLNPKMFVKTCVFRHSFSCHFFFCVVFKELFASVFSVWLRCCSETLVRVALLRVPRLSFAASRHTKNSFAKPVWEFTFFQTISFGLRCTLKTNQCRTAFAAAKNKMVGLGRLELLTSRLSGVRSNQLSYRPM